MAIFWLLRYESSTLKLYTELSSSIFQSLWVGKASATPVQISTLFNIYKGIYKCPLLTLDYYYNYYRATWWLDRIFCGRTRCHLAKFYESLHLLTDWEFVLGIQIIATTATEGNMFGKLKKKLRHMCTSDFERVYLENLELWATTTVCLCCNLQLQIYVCLHKLNYR